MEGPEIELVQSFLESPRADLACQVASRPVVKDCPEANRFTEGVSRHVAKEKWRRMFGFDNERFESAWGDDAEV
jgi:hypothetical protein